MTHGFLLSLIAVVCVAYAILGGGAAWLLLWPAAAFAVVGAAYMRLGASVFGKRPDGRLRVWSGVLLLPYLTLTWGLWHLWRLAHRGGPYATLLPGITIGRRLLPSEFPADVARVVDLTCEFPASIPLTTTTAYRCLPILDGHVPRYAELLALLEELRRSTGSVYVHCANGHGRTGLVAASVLLLRGHAADAGEALEAVRARRSGVRLSRVQMRMLRRVAVDADSLDPAPPA